MVLNFHANTFREDMKQGGNEADKSDVYILVEKGAVLFALPMPLRQRA